MGRDALSDEDRDLMDLFHRAHDLMIEYPEGSKEHTFALELKKDYGDKWDERT